jgi:hypothetical protein
VWIDRGMMLAAISRIRGAADLPRDKAFLHRGDGDIVFLHDSDGPGAARGGGGAAGGGSDRARLAASPGEWLAIPGYDSRVEGRGNEEAFVRRFLREHGILGAMR